MLFFVRHEDKEFRVLVESRRGQLYVRFEEESEKPLDLVFYGNDCLLLEDGKVFAANVSGKKMAYTVWRPTGNVEFGVESEYRRIIGLLRGQQITLENNVYAKMPGKIVKILMKVGDKVEKGKGVMVMEAMKMENEIRAPMNGEITHCLVKEGQTVETGALLMEIKPCEE